MAALGKEQNSDPCMLGKQPATIEAQLGPNNHTFALAIYRQYVSARPSRT